MIIFEKSMATLSNGLKKYPIIGFFSYLFRFVSPFLIFPLLSQRLGLYSFGTYLSAYSLAIIVSIVTEYGFNLSGTRDLAGEQSFGGRSAIASKVVLAKVLLIPISIVFGLCLSEFNPALKNVPLLVWSAILLGCAQGGTAFWYFSGVNKVFTAAALEIVGQVIALVYIYFNIHDSSDGLLAIFSQAIFSLLFAVIGNIMIFRHTFWSRPNIRDGVWALRDGFPIFLMRAAITIYTGASVFLLSALTSPLQVALFGVSERVTSVASIVFRPFASILMPRMVRVMHEDTKEGFYLTIKLLLFFVILFVIVAIIIVASAENILNLFFGLQFVRAQLVLQLLAVTLPIVAISQVLGFSVLAPLRMDNVMFRSVLIGGVTNIIIAVILVPKYGATGMAMARILTELIITAAYIVAIRKHLSSLIPLWKVM